MSIGNYSKFRRDGLSFTSLLNFGTSGTTLRSENLDYISYERMWTVYRGDHNVSRATYL
jgi:hypothetical protein